MGRKQKYKSFGNYVIYKLRLDTPRFERTIYQDDTRNPLSSWGSGQEVPGTGNPLSISVKYSVFIRN